MVLDRDALEVWKEVPPTGSGIAKVIRCARRFRAWHRSLRLEERRYLEAVSRVVDAIRSPLLLKVVGGLLARLMKAVRGIPGAGLGIGRDLGFMMATVGRALAKRISLIAQGWGNRRAFLWASDAAFIRYLTVMHINAPIGYDISA